jgi:hypothetical protein
MFGFVRLWVGILVRLFRCRRCLWIENLALRQQLAVFKRQNSRPRLAAADATVCGDATISAFFQGDQNRRRSTQKQWDYCSEG